MNIELLRHDAIQVLDNRQRQVTDEAHIKSLQEDILENGLIHPITVTPDNILVAGFCRLTAIRTLATDFRFGDSLVPRGHIPVIRLDKDRTALDLFRVEFAENEKRLALAPVDRAKALANLHRNLEAVAKEKGENWTIRQTAGEVVKLEGGAPATHSQKARAGEIADALIIDAFKDDPDIQSAPTREAAAKLAKRKLESQFTQMLGAKVVTEQGSSPALNDTLRVFKGDFRTFPIEENLYAGAICDPPYGVSADAFGDQSFSDGHEYTDSLEVSVELCQEILSRAFRSVRDGGHLYMFCDIRRWPELKEQAQEVGWVVYPTPLIWDKGFGHAPQVGFFARHYECILFAAKGMTRRLNKTTSDVFNIPGVRVGKLHAAQKPVDLLVQLMRLSFFPGERVVDYTCGSGTIFAAAHQAGLRADGFEREEKYFNISAQLIAGLLAGERAAPSQLSIEDDEETT